MLLILVFHKLKLIFIYISFIHNFVYFLQVFLVSYLFFYQTYTLYCYCGVGTQQCQEKRQEGQNEEKMDRGRKRNHPPQPRQLMSVWGKKKRTENRRKNKRKKQGVGSHPSYLDHLVVSYDPHGLYGEPILNPPPTWEINK